VSPSGSGRTNPSAHRVVILTAIPVEYEAVVEHLTDVWEEKHLRGTIYGRGKFAGYDRVWDVAIAEVGAGNIPTASAVERAITHFDPRAILLVGVAGGLKDVALGDVVAVTDAFQYESGKAEARFWPRTKVGISTFAMEQRARAEVKKSVWLKRLKGPTPASVPKVLIGPIAAGEKVVASNLAPVFKFLRQYLSDALAVEMEGYGFLEAAHSNTGTEALVIRGISDLIGNKAVADVAGYQKIAAQHASAFAFEILARLDPLRDEDRTAIQGRLAGVTFASAQSDMQDLSRDYSPDAIVRQIRALMAIEADQTLCGRWCFALRYLWSPAAQCLLGEIRDNPDQHAYVKREAAKTLENCEAAGLAEEKPPAGETTQIARWCFVLNGQVDDFERGRVEAILTYLQALLQDPDLTLVRIEAGSMRLVLEGKRDAFGRLLSLVRAGHLTAVLGIEIESVMLVDPDVPGPGPEREGLGIEIESVILDGVVRRPPVIDIVLLKTVLELDLLAYSDVARSLDENVVAGAVLRLNAQIQQFVDQGLQSIRAVREQTVLATTGDGAILGFDDARSALMFAKTVQSATRDYNTRKTERSAKRWFRMGAATG